MSKQSIYGLTRENLAARLGALGEPRFRADQVFTWLYDKLALEPEAMTDLPTSLRQKLAGLFSFDLPAVDQEVGSPDGTTKYRLRPAEGDAVECVAMPDDEGGGVSLCISSQVGCALRCAFCRTGTMGLKRNLDAAEIVAQVVLMLSRRAERPPTTNILFMGMGEPLLNLEAVLTALEVLGDPKGLAMPMRRIVISTAGIPDAIRSLYASNRLPKAPLLAVSLNAPDQELRQRLMPIAARHPLPELMAAIHSLPTDAIRRERVTIEYVLLRGVNDSAEHARKLARLLGGMRVKVNLIPYNRCQGLPFEPPEERAIEAFLAVLSDSGLPCMVRRSRGGELSAACGQLAVESEERDK
jgi:23S rRNA (adenine2503-C2)-methyltransferase